MHTENKGNSIGENLERIHELRSKWHRINQEEIYGCCNRVVSINEKKDNYKFEMFCLELVTLFQMKAIQYDTTQQTIQCDVIVDFEENTLTYRWDDDPKGLRRTFNLEYPPYILKYVNQPFIDGIGLGRKEEGKKIVLSFWFPI